MKKKIRKIMPQVLIVFLLIVGVSAGIILTNRDKTVDYDKGITDALATKGIEDWNVSDYKNDDEMQRCLISPTAYNLPCSGKMPTFFMNCSLRNETTNECENEVRVDYTEKEKEEMFDVWEKERMKGIGGTIINRANEQPLEKYAEGTTTPRSIL